jgi:alkylhydroperoxidase family enzyme
MPNIAYYPVEDLTDPELRGYLEHAARNGTPRPESQAIRAHVPAVLRAFSRVWDVAFRNGVMDHSIKELCRLYVSKTVECDYCGSQRSLRGREEGVTEPDVDDLLEFERSERYDERQKAALAYASHLVWMPEGADAAVYARLREHFTEEQITELGYFVSATFGQQRWIPTLGIDHLEVLNITKAGLAPDRLGAPRP